MKCDEVQTWLMTAETPHRPSAEVRRHVRSCAACRKTFRQLVRLIHEVENAPSLPVPAGPRDRLLAQLEPRTAAAPDAPLFASEAAVLPLPARRSLAWTRGASWAAAALLCLGLGLGLALLLRHDPVGPGPRAQDELPDPEVPRSTLEERVLDRHLVLAETREPGRRLDTLTGLASDVEQESLTLARQEKADDLAVLVWLHGRILHEGILKSARKLTDQAQALLGPVVRSLHQAERTAVELAGRSPEGIAASLRQLGRQASAVALALQGGADPVPLPARAPVAVDARALLQVLVVTSVQLAHEDDPVRRAEQSSQATDALARRLSEAAQKSQEAEMARLSGALEALFERAVQPNLERIDFETIDPIGRRLMDQVQQQAGEAVERMQPQLPQLPPAARVNLQRAIELARQVQQPPRGKGPPWKKDKPRGPPRNR